MNKKKTKNIFTLIVSCLLLIFLSFVISAQETPPPETPPIPEGTGCAEAWICSQWSECTNGQQTRTCTDSNNCGTTNEKPLESQSCGSGTTQPAQETEEQPSEPSAPGTENISKTEEPPETKEAPKTEETKEATNKTEETTGKEEGEGSTFFSGLKLKIMIILPIFIIAGVIIFLVFKKKTITTEQPSYGVVEEQKKEETKMITEEKPAMPSEEAKLPVEEAKIDPKLAEYIQTSIKKGFTKGQIKESLIKAGWDGKEVDQALAQV